jgi:hypothetical protein
MCRWASSAGWRRSGESGITGCGSSSASTRRTTSVRQSQGAADWARPGAGHRCGDGAEGLADGQPPVFGSIRRRESGRWQIRYRTRDGVRVAWPDLIWNDAQSAFADSSSPCLAAFS